MGSYRKPSIDMEEDEINKATESPIELDSNIKDGSVNGNSKPPSYNSRIAFGSVYNSANEDPGPSLQNSRTKFGSIYSKISSGAHLSRQKSMDLAKDGIWMAQSKYREAKDRTRETDWKQVRTDFRHNLGPWIRTRLWPTFRYIMMHLLILAMVVLTFICAIEIGLESARGRDVTWPICGPNGAFNPDIGSTYNFWDVSGFFQITLSFGSFSFSTVKVIDVIWDVVVGRGVQTILALICYVVFTKCIQQNMETSTISYGTFEALAFNSTSLYQITQLLANISSGNGIKGKLQIIWMILAAAYVVAFSTLASAMSGYAAHVTPMVNVNSITVPVGDVQPLTFIIHDFWRLGLDTPYVPATTTGLLEDTDTTCQYLDSGMSYGHSYRYTNYYGNGGILLNPETNQLNWTLVPKACYLLAATTNYVTNNSVYTDQGYKTHSKASLFYLNGAEKPITLPEPTLNITIEYMFSRYATYFGSYNNSVPEYDYNWDETSFLYDNQTYTYDDLKSRGTCIQSDHPKYSWGFSYMFLIVTSILGAVWALGMYIMWLESHLHSRYNRAGRQMGTYRATLDLAKAMRKDMGEDATENLSNSELKQLVSRGLNGGRIGYEMLDQPGSGRGMLPMTRWDSVKLWWRNGWSNYSLRKKILIILTIIIILVIIIAPTATSLTQNYDY